MEKEAGIKEACKQTVARLDACIKQFSQFTTGKAVKQFLERGVETSFQTIVASGKDAADPHFFGDGKLEKGFCVIDFGIKHKGWCADMTRTIYLGTPSSEEKRLYQYILQEHYRLLSLVKKGQSLQYLEKQFRKRIGHLKHFFPHRIGHGLGKEVHEALPFKHFREGDVLTIEPGLYEQGVYGIRIEDVLRIGKQTEVLTPLSRELVAIPAFHP